MLFQSTLPLRGATRVHVRDAVLDLDVISIHTPLAGSDVMTGRLTYAWLDFNPHSPCGERHENTTPPPTEEEFQSTLPLRGATMPKFFVWDRLRISIHTPLAGSDKPTNQPVHEAYYFNPHSPCGERPGEKRQMAKLIIFQSTLPLRGATYRSNLRSQAPTNFNPHSPCGERHGFGVMEPRCL